MEWWVIGLLLGVGAPISAAGVEAIRRWYQRRSVAGTIRRIPLLPIMEVIPGPGICAIQGHARAHATMTCPFTEDPIIGVRVKIDFVQRSSSEQDSGPLRQIVDFTEMKPFEVFDDSGVALVRGEPTVLLGLPWMQDSDQFAVDITDPWLEHKIQMEGFSNTDLVVARKVSCHVRLLRPGSPVYVLGRSIREVDPGGSGESSYREPPTRLVLEPPAGGVLMVADCHHGELLEKLQQRLQ